MIRACLGLLAGAYAPHFTSFAAVSDVVLFAVLVTFLLLWAGREAAAGFLSGLLLFVAVTGTVFAVRSLIVAMIVSFEVSPSRPRAEARTSMSSRCTSPRRSTRHAMATP